MASVYSTRFLHGSTERATPYTVPAGHTAVIRTITAVNTNATPASWSVSMSTIATYICGGMLEPFSTSTSGLHSVLLDMHHVVPAGETFSALPSPGVHMVISGYLLSDLTT